MQYFVKSIKACSSFIGSAVLLAVAERMVHELFPKKKKRFMSYGDTLLLFLGLYEILRKYLFL